MQCPRCQKLLPPGARFCSNCGTGLTPQPTPPSQQYGPPPQQYAPPPAPFYQPQPQPQAYYPGYQPPAPAPQHRVMGQPLHVWLIVAAVIAFVALLLPWYSTRASGRVTWKETGYEYSDGSRNTWYIPQATVSTYGGGNGMSAFTVALAGMIGGLGIRYRSGAWPRWARYTLAGTVGLVGFIGIVNTVSDPNLGPLLFAAAAGLALPATLRVLAHRAEGLRP